MNNTETQLCRCEEQAKPVWIRRLGRWVAPHKCPKAFETFAASGCSCRVFPFTGNFGKIGSVCWKTTQTQPTLNMVHNVFSALARCFSLRGQTTCTGLLLFSLISSVSYVYDVLLETIFYISFISRSASGGTGGRRDYILFKVRKRMLLKNRDIYSLHTWRSNFEMFCRTYNSRQ